MKEKILSGMIGSAMAILLLPGMLEAPGWSLPSAGASAVTQRPAAFLSYLKVADRASSPAKVVGAGGRESVGVKTTATRVYAIDERSGSELYALNPEEPSPLASMTKLMTARVVRSHGLDWDSMVTMSGVKPDGGAAYFADGDQVTVRDLWNAMLVGSSNTAALKLAEATGLSAEEFAAEMNANAAGLGMAHTRFVEPTGLDEGNISTAADVAKLARAEFADPEVTAATRKPYFDLVKVAGKPKRVASTDKLLDSFIARPPYSLLAGKTGYIMESGYNIVISVSKKGAAPVTVVVMGAASDKLRFQEAKSVAYWAFENYRWPAKITAAIEK